MLRHLLVVCLAACANRAIPQSLVVEQTVPAKPAANELPEQLRVVTFNVHRETAAHVIDGITNDRELANADLIILEEVHRDETVPAWCSAACALGKRLGFYVMYAPGHAQDTGSDGVAILSRAPITSYEVLELPYFNVHFNSGRRVALAATVMVGATPVAVYAVHLDNRLTVHDRRTQMKPVLEHAKQREMPVIIAGDFNTGPTTWLTHVVPVPTGTQPRRLEQFVRSYGFATPVADSGPTHRYIGMKLDAIYTRGMDTVAFATANGRNVSDHIALWATMHPSAQ